jgi:DNA-binding transcriptional ArsR family regulator
MFVKTTAPVVSHRRITPARRNPVEWSWPSLFTYNRMVVGNTDEQTDRIFRALADATRRDIVLTTLEAELNVSAIARRYPMSFAAVQKHVAVLEDAGLVTKQRNGREHLVRANVATLRRAHRLLEQLEAVWTARIERMGELLAEDRNEGTP